MLANRNTASEDEPYIVVRGVSVPHDGLPRLISPDGISQGGTWRGIFRVKMYNGELVWTFQVFVDYNKSSIFSVWEVRQQCA